MIGFWLDWRGEAQAQGCSRPLGDGESLPWRRPLAGESSPSSVQCRHKLEGNLLKWPLEPVHYEKTGRLFIMDASHSLDSGESWRRAATGASGFREIAPGARCSRVDLEVDGGECSHPLSRSGSLGTKWGGVALHGPRWTARAESQGARSDTVRRRRELAGGRAAVAPPAGMDAEQVVGRRGCAGTAGRDSHVHSAKVNNDSISTLALSSPRQINRRDKAQTNTPPTRRQPHQRLIAQHQTRDRPARYDVAAPH